MSRVSRDAAQNLIKVDLSNNFEYFDIATYLSEGSNVTLPSIYENGKKLVLARYPDYDYSLISSVSCKGTEATGYGVIGFSEENPLNWTKLDNVYIEHYGSNDWYMEWTKLRNVNKDTKTMEMDAYVTYEFKEGKRWSAVNVIEELNLPGEYYIDKDNGCMYIYPYSTNAGMVEFSYAALSEPMLLFDNCSGITVSGIDFGYNNNYAIKVGSQCENITINNCVFHDLKSAVYVSGKNCTVDSNDMYNITSTAVNVSGGDKETLTHNNNVVKYNQISNLGGYRYGFGKTVGVTMSGTGTTLLNNIIHGNAAGGVLMNDGCEMTVSNNEIYNVIHSVGDAGAIYTGYNLSSYGSFIKNNYIHDFYSKGNGLTEGNYGIYIDDWFSGINIYDNVISKTTEDKASVGIYFASGRDNTAIGNTLINMKTGFYMADRYEQSKWIPSESKLSVMVNSLKYAKNENSPFTQTYPLVRDTYNEYYSAYKEPVDSAKVSDFWTNFIKNTDVEDNILYADKNIVASKFSELGTVENNTLNSNTLTKSDILSLVENTGILRTIGYNDKPVALPEFSELYPYDGSIIGNENINFLWETVPYADEYYYEISENKDFSNIVISGTTFENGVKVAYLAGNKTYYWRVTAKNTSCKTGTTKTAQNINTFSVLADENAYLTAYNAEKVK